MEDEKEKKNSRNIIRVSFEHTTFIVCSGVDEQAVGCTKLEKCLC